MMKKLLLTLLCLPMIGFGQSPQTGDFHQGGVVFYIDTIGKGLIIDTAYLEATYNWVNGYPMHSFWGSQWTNAFGAVEEFIGAGQFNTNNLASSNTNDYASNVCYNSNSGGYTDWFLPSHDELWQIMLNVDLIDSVINLYGGDPIDSAYHWSSTQVNMSYARIAYAYSTNLETGESAGPGQYVKSKNTGALVRAIRCIDNDCAFMGAPIFGCNDSIAENYDATAAINDYSCVYIMGCTDLNSCNYDSVATMNDYSCDYSCIGCTDPLALNYLGASITMEDGSCLYCAEDYQTISVTYDSAIDNSVFFAIYNWQETIIPLEEVSEESYNKGFCIPDGCYTVDMIANCNISTEDWVGNTLTIGDTSIILEDNTISVNIYIGEGSCDIGCTDANYIEYEVLAVIDDGSCLTLITTGCIDENADNYNPNVNTNDGSCEYSCPLNAEGIEVTEGWCYYYMSSGESTIEELIEFGFDCTCVEVGCIDILACNYNSLANIDDNSCIYPLLENIDCKGNCLYGDADDDGICDCDNMDLTIMDCACDFFDPNTYTIFYTDIDEENCVQIEACYCECYNDFDNDGICDENEISYDCLNNTCVDPLNGNGLYSNIAECEAECQTSSITDASKVNKKLKKITDLLGQEIPIRKNTTMFYIYDDGSVEKKVIIE